MIPGAFSVTTESAKSDARIKAATAATLLITKLWIEYAHKRPVPEIQARFINFFQKSQQTFLGTGGLPSNTKLGTVARAFVDAVGHFFTLAPGVLNALPGFREAVTQPEEARQKRIQAAAEKD
jgi:hypothetical protein